MQKLRLMLPSIAICRATHAGVCTAAWHPGKSRNLYFHSCSSVLACSYANIWHSWFGKLSCACWKLAGQLPGLGEKLAEQDRAVFSFVLLPGFVQRAGSLGREQKIKDFSTKPVFFNLSSG